MTMRILALALLTALANAQQPAPGAEHKPGARPAHSQAKPGARQERSDAKPDGDVARARRLHALADLDGDGVVSARERQWVHMVLAQWERADKNDDGKLGPRERERAKENLKEHAEERRDERREHVKEHAEERAKERAGKVEDRKPDARPPEKVREQQTPEHAKPRPIRR